MTPEQFKLSCSSDEQRKELCRGVIRDILVEQLVSGAQKKYLAAIAAADHAALAAAGAELMAAHSLRSAAMIARIEQSRGISL